MNSHIWQDHVFDIGLLDNHTSLNAPVDSTAFTVWEKRIDNTAR